MNEIPVPTGNMYIEGTGGRGEGEAFHAIDPATGARLEPAFGSALARDIDRACDAASRTSEAFANTSSATRAELLRAMATRLEDAKETITDQALRETGLSTLRLDGELTRTCMQLEHFAELLGRPEALRIIVDEGDTAPSSLPRPALRQLRVPLGPVAVFGASNFPLAFSVAGGDTASAFAAGCPVIVKGHPAHPGTSERVAQCVVSAIDDVSLPAGIFALLQGADTSLGATLVRDPRMAAVGFTGSRSGGIALTRLAAMRPVPIPVFAEMSSINPVFLLPGALNERAESLATQFLDSLTLGAGQFCTCPGVLFGIDSPALERFVTALRNAAQANAATTMLTPGIHAAYVQGANALARRPGVSPLALGIAADRPHAGQLQIYQTDAHRWLDDARLADEVFGSTALLVRCHSFHEMQQALDALEGQLTGTLLIAESDTDAARALMPGLQQRVGRVVCNAFPTGVQVSAAMVHGGPWPATSDGRSTSVGAAAIERFQRPLCFQDVPPALLPAALQ